LVATLPLLHNKPHCISKVLEALCFLSVDHHCGFFLDCPNSIAYPAPVRKGGVDTTAIGISTHVLGPRPVVHLYYPPHSHYN
jgi:hypothetical protein